MRTAVGAVKRVLPEKFEECANGFWQARESIPASQTPDAASLSPGSVTPVKTAFSTKIDTRLETCSILGEVKPDLAEYNRPIPRMTGTLSRTMR